MTSIFMVLLMKVYIPRLCNVMMEEIDEVSLDELAERLVEVGGRERKSRGKAALNYRSSYIHIISTNSTLLTRSK